MKTTRHSLMAKGILVLLSLLVMVFAISFSWFNSKQEAVATGLSGGVESTGDFEYAVGFHTSQTFDDYVITAWTNESTALQFDQLRARLAASEDIAANYSTYNLLYDYTPIDVTGDGATLIRPSMSYGNSRINTTVNDYSLADPNVQYINFDLFFRSEMSGVDVKLGDGSYAVGACEIKNRNKTDVGNGAIVGDVASGSQNYNPSNYSAVTQAGSTSYNFSKDAIVGAIRVAFVPYTFENISNNVSGINSSNLYSETSNFLSKEASLLWMPRPEIKVTPRIVDNDEQTTGWTLSTDSADATYTLDGFGSTTYHNNKHTYYKIFKGASDNANHTVVEYPDTVTPEVLSDTETDNSFTTISSQLKIGKYYYTKVNVRIWVEGTDLESRRAFSGGRFAVNFKFKTQ